MTTPKYFEDQSPEIQAAQRMRRREEVAAIGRLGFPVRAHFGGQPVKILGPADRFSPYKEQAKGPEDPFQLMVQSERGGRFITLASCLKVDGVPLVSQLLPLRPTPNLFARLGPCRVPAQCVGERAPVASVATRNTKASSPRMSA